MNSYEQIEKELMEKLDLKSTKQSDITELYAKLIQSGKPGDSYAEINTAIVNRWSMSGLRKIKTGAWEIVENRG